MQRKILQVLKLYAPEYVQFWLKYRKTLFQQLFFTVKFWTRKYKRILRKNSQRSFKIAYLNPKILKNSQLFSGLTNLKIIECVSFWKGFIEQYGSFPPKLQDKPLPQLRNALSNNKGASIAVIIPIGNNTTEYLTILQQSLSVLYENSLINQVYCIVDGRILPEKFENWIKNQEKFSLLYYRTKVGPATIRNHGLKLCNQGNFSDVLLLDADILLTKNSLHNLLSAYLNTSYSIVFPKIISQNNSILDYYYDINGILNGRILANHKSDNELLTSLLLYGTTSVVLINQVIFRNNISFDENFKIAAGEDIDFCLNLIHSGHSLIGFENVFIQHYYGNNDISNAGIQTFKSRFERYGRGDAILLQKHPYFYAWLNKTQPRI